MYYQSPCSALSHSPKPLQGAWISWSLQCIATYLERAGALVCRETKLLRLLITTFYSRLVERKRKPIAWMLESLFKCWEGVSSTKSSTKLKRLVLQLSMGTHSSTWLLLPLQFVQSSGSQPGCRGTLGCHLQYPGVPRANAFFNILLKIHFQTVIKPWSKIVWVRHWVSQIIILFSRVPKA